MVALIARRSLTLTNAVRQLVSPLISIDSLTATIVVRLRRPTTINPLAWGVADRIQVTLKCFVGAVEYQCVGRATGGVLVTPLGIEQQEYALLFNLPRLFGDEAREYIRTSTPDGLGFYDGVPLTRIGQTAGSIQAQLVIDRLSGRIETELLVAETVAKPAPLIRHKNSVAFDAATDAAEVGGDGVLSLSHTASGSNRAAWVYVAHGAGGGNGGSYTATYGGSAMAELFESAHGSFYRQAGYSFVAPSTSATTVTATCASFPGGGSAQGLGVISMTGVDQTTPTGTVPTVTDGNSTTPSITVASVGADDMVVDGLFADNDTSASQGAGQTTRFTENPDANVSFRGSTQGGGSGGVMSWTKSTTEFWFMGAVAFKPAAGSGAYSLTATASAYALTGIAAATRVGRKIAGGIGAYSLGGVASTLKSSRKLDGQVQTYLLTGVNANLNKGVLLSAAARAFNLTGVAASLLAIRTISISPAGFTLGLQPANLRATRRIAAATGSYVASGQVASLAPQRKVVASTGVLVVTGQAAQFRHTAVLAAVSRSFVLVGNAVALTFAGYSMNAMLAGLGIAPRVLAQIKLRPRIEAKIEFVIDGREGD